MKHERIVYYDGVCGLCNKFVNFLIKKDVAEKLRYAPLKGKAAQAIPKVYDQVDSVIYSQGGRFYIKSNAALRVLYDLGGIYKMTMIFKIIPRFVRDWVYDFIAKRRYERYGKLESCPIPEKKLSHLFIE